MTGFGELEEARERLAASLEQPSVARVYDYYLGGNSNFKADREFAKQQLELFPGMASALLANRRFLGRAVRYAVAQGVRQFVDFGSGLPTAGNVHEVADQEAPGECRVVYVDNEPLAHTHATVLLADTADTTRHHALRGDVLEYEQLWQRVLDTGAIAPDEPTCLLAVALLHFMPPSTHPERALEYYRSKLAPGSLLALTHGCNNRGEDTVRQVAENYSQTTSSTVHLRTRAEFTELFGEWPIVDPGVVWVDQWRPDREPDEEPDASRILAGVARSRG